jgi:hypothetical protein
MTGMIVGVERVAESTQSRDIEKAIKLAEII